MKIKELINYKTPALLKKDSEVAKNNQLLSDNEQIKKFLLSQYSYHNF